MSDEKLNLYQRLRKELGDGYEDFQKEYFHMLMSPGAVTVEEPEPGGDGQVTGNRLTLANGTASSPFGTGYDITVKALCSFELILDPTLPSTTIDMEEPTTPVIANRVAKAVYDNPLAKVMTTTEQVGSVGVYDWDNDGTNIPRAREGDEWNLLYVVAEFSKAGDLAYSYTVIPFKGQ